MRILGVLAIGVLVFGSTWALLAFPLAIFQQVGATDTRAFQFFGWIPAAVVGVLALRAADQSFPPKRSEGRKGHCAACDYNLRGNVSGVCPECGTPVELKN